MMSTRWNMLSEGVSSSLSLSFFPLLRAFAPARSTVDRLAARLAVEVLSASRWSDVSESELSCRRSKRVRGLSGCSATGRKDASLVAGVSFILRPRDNRASSSSSLSLERYDHLPSGVLQTGCPINTSSSTHTSNFRLHAARGGDSKSPRKSRLYPSA